MTDVQQLIDDFNHTAREFDLLMRRTERRISPGEFENEASKLEQCRSIVHQLVIRINSRSYRRHFSRNLSETGKLLQELNSRKSVASEVVSNVVQQFKSLEEEFERLIRPRDSVRHRLIIPCGYSSSVFDTSFHNFYRSNQLNVLYRIGSTFVASYIEYRVS